MPSPRNFIHVLHIASGDRWAGAEVQLWTLLSELQKRPDVRPRAILMNEGETADRLRHAHIPVDVLDETRMSGVQILFALRQLLYQYHPDIIHTHRRKENILGAVANAMSIRAPCVRTVHGAPEHTPAWSMPHKRLLYWLDCATGRYLQNSIIAVSQDLRNKLGNIFPPPKIVVIENGVDVAAIQAQVNGPADFRAAQPDHRHIGIVGRLEPVKRVDIFLGMAAELQKSALPWPLAFHVLGDGTLMGPLRDLSHQLHLDNVVTFHGHRPDIHTSMASLDIMIMCSDHEGMPIAALEALSLGTLVIANRVGGLIDALDNGQAGVLIEDRNSNAYAAAVDGLLRRPKVANRLRQRGRQVVEGRYSSSTNADRTLSLYRTDCLAGSEAPPTVRPP